MTEAQSGVTDVDIVALRPGARIGRHEVLAVLGQGGFGITYLARDSQLNREVAIKEYLPTSLAYRSDGITVLPRSTRVADDFTWGRDRFVAEGQTLASLHRAPGIVHVFDFLEINGTAYIVMEMLHGDTLAGRIKRDGPLDPAAVERILWILLDGLEQVHEAGFLHRDIKPANILLDAQGNPTLIDFGASRAAMADRTTAMTAIFTPGYAAGEQMTSARQGPWTDIYGLSATLYHALVGKAPPNAFDRMLDDTYEPLVRMTMPGLSPAMAAGLDAGLAVRASDRPQSIAGCRRLLSMGSPASADATQLMSRTVDPEAMRTPRTSPSTPSDRESPLTPTPPPTAKRRTLLYAGIAAAVALLAGGGWFALSPALLPTNAPPAKAPPAGTTVLQEMKVEDLERALADRRAADAAAAEKKRLVEEALRKAEADAAAKLAADADLAKAETARRQAEDELARLKAEIAVRRQEETQAQALARRAEAEAAQRRAEAEMAALRQAEDDARQKAAAEADAKVRADEALLKAQAERQAADEQASRKAAIESKEKAEASASQVAAAEARGKAEADAAAAEKKAAESAEAALRLAPADLQRLQLALTSLGFDTRGSDGAFGPRTRETIAAWQKARGQSSTGFLTAAQQQALLREAAPALQKYDDDLKKKQDEAKRKDEEDKKRAEADAKAKAGAAAASSQPPTVASPGPGAPSVSTAPTAYDGQWVGSVVPRNGPLQHITLQIRNGEGSATWHNMRCQGDVTLSLTIRPDGSYTALLDGMDMQCGKSSGRFAGAVQANQIAFTSGQGVKFALRR